MVEVDPLVLLAAGAAVVGVASVLICTVKPTAKPEKKSSSSSSYAAAAASAPAANAPVSASASATLAAPAPKIGKKKAKRHKKKKSSVNSETEEDASPQSAGDEKLTVEVAHSGNESDSDFEFSPQFIQSNKAKKAKETPEQKAARLERQKEKAEQKAILAAVAAANAAAAAEEQAKIATAPVPVPESDDFPTSTEASDAVQPDGWAVVEGRKKKPDDASPEQKEDVPAAAEKSSKKKGKAAAEAAAAAQAAAAQTDAAEELPPAPVIEIDSVTTQMTVDSKKLGLLIGPKGVTKIGIQNATGAQIEMPKTEKDYVGPVTIDITGPAAAVGKASAAIHELCNKGYSMLLAGPDFQEGYIAVPQKHLPDIIGKGGANIRAMQNHTGVKISTPAAPKGVDAADLPSKVKIGLAGPREQVTECRFLIKDLIKYYHTSVTHPGVVHAEVDVPSSYYNYIIGSKGSEIKHIQGNYSVSVHIPNADSSCEHILVVGLPENVTKAEQHIRKLVEKVDAQNEKRAQEQAQREAEAAQRAANAAAAREARAAAAAAARAGQDADSAPVAYSIGGGSNLAADKTLRRRKNDEDDPRVPGDEWMDNFAPPSKSLAISSMLPSQFAGKEGQAEAGAEGEDAAASPEAAKKSDAKAAPAMEFPTPAEVLGRKGRAANPAPGLEPALEEGEVAENSPAPASAWNKN